MTDVKQISLTIEGRPVTVPDGTSILEAAKVAGVLVPHYCYHPGLPVAGVCRMCLVDVEKMPKLAPACATAAMEGQVVHVHSEKALEARKGVLEFLLINHPLDCPICDQAGECELQDYTFAEGRADSRYREPKRFNPVEDFGGDVLYVPNRCILCTRCVRFMSDVAHEPVLNVSERGDRAFIGKAEGQDLTNPWAGNVIDLCPVGALLSKDYLNRARAWELDRAATVCTGCSQGCNLVAESRDAVVVRLKPRPNLQVNQYYACDVGRLGYRELNRRDRAEHPMVRRQGALVAADWSAAITTAAGALNGGPIRVIASPNLSNEALFQLERLLATRGGSGSMRVPRGEECPLPGAPDVALRTERAANATAARLLGFHEVADPAATVQAGDRVLIVGDDLRDLAPECLTPAATVVYLGTTLPAALAGRVEVVLPLANVLEEEGSLTNLRGHVQRYFQARSAPGLARPTWYVLSELAGAMGLGAPAANPAELFARLTATHAAFAGLVFEALGLEGARMAGGATPALGGEGA